jgi:hypothetical protein
MEQTRCEGLRMKPNPSLRPNLADATLVGVLLFAALSQVVPRLSGWFTIAACALVAAFAVMAYLPAMRTTPKEKSPGRPEPRVSTYADLFDSYSECRFEMQHMYFLAPRFSKRVTHLTSSTAWPAGRSQSRNAELVDLTDALPDNCVVRIGQVEIRLEDGETSVRMRSGRNSDSLRAKPTTYVLDAPRDVRQSHDFQKNELN